MSMGTEQNNGTGQTQRVGPNPMLIAINQLTQMLVNLAQTAGGWAIKLPVDARVSPPGVEPRQRAEIHVTPAQLMRDLTEAIQENTAANLDDAYEDGFEDGQAEAEDELEEQRHGRGGSKRGKNKRG